MIINDDTSKYIDEIYDYDLNNSCIKLLLKQHQEYLMKKFHREEKTLHDKIIEEITENECSFSNIKAADNLIAFNKFDIPNINREKILYAFEVLRDSSIIMNFIFKFNSTNYIIKKCFIEEANIRFFMVNDTVNNMDTIYVINLNDIKMTR